MGPSEVLDYLLARRLVRVRDLVDGEVRVEDASRRNRNFRVTSRLGRSYLLKRAEDRASETAQTLRSEARFYSRALADRRFAPLRIYLPRFFGYDQRHRLLILELREGKAPDAGADEGRAELHTIARDLARALARCHGALRSSRDRRPQRGYPPSWLPWALGVAIPGPEALRSITGGQLEVIRAVQQDQAAVARLGELRMNWLSTSLIHGDIRWDNVLVSNRSEPAGSNALTLIDWELSSLGDPAWDVGCAFAAVIQAFLATLLPDCQDAAALGARFTACLPLAQEPIAALWATYREEAKLDPATCDGFVDRATCHLGARLVQASYEHAHDTDVIPLQAIPLLQLGINVLHRPADARRLVLGLSA